MWIFPDHMRAVGENYSLESFFPSGYIIAHSLFLFSRLIILAAEPLWDVSLWRYWKERGAVLWLHTWSPRHLQPSQNPPQCAPNDCNLACMWFLSEIRTPTVKAAAISAQGRAARKPLPGPRDQSAWFSSLMAAGQGSEGGVRKISQLLEGIASHRVPKHFYWNLRWREKLMPIFQF